MVATPVFAGFSEGDNASLEAGGVHFLCVVWRNVARNTIDARIETRGGNGERSVVWEGVIRDTEEDGAESALADSPKVLALGGAGYFVVHWLEWEPSQASQLFRATFNTATIQSGWVLQSGGPTPQSGWHIWDHAPVRESTPGTENQFVVAWIDSETTAVEIDYGGPGIARYQSPYAWTDVVWTATPSWLVMNRVLALAADDDADAVVGLVAQASGYQLWGFQLDSADGLNPALSQISTGHADSEYSQAALVQVPGLSDAVVFAEYVLQADQATGGYAARSRGLLYREIDLGNGCAPLSSVQAAQNLHLGSRPWMRRNGYSGEYEVYAYVTFKSLAEDQEWDQTYGYVVKGNRHDWGASVPANTIRLLPVSAITNGSVDGRSGGLGTGTAGGGTGFPTGSSLTGSTVNKRSNHVSSVAPGPQAIALSPDARSVSVASVHFEQNIADQDSDAADGSRSRAQAAIKLVRFHHEDPWTVREDDQDPDLPSDDNFRGVARYSGGQTVELASGLMISGGVLSVYDGSQVVENGFLWAPEIVNASVNVGVGVHGAGVYWYVANYRWVSPSGAIHRGPLSRPVAVTTAAGDGVTLTIRTIGLTLKDDRHLYPNAGRVMIEVWRTTLQAGLPEGVGAGEYLFRRLFHGSTSSMGMEDTPQNDANVYAITVGDTQPDSVLQYADPMDWQLDTATLQWNLQPPIPTPALRVMGQRRNRLWGVPMDDPRVLVYSDEALPLGLQTAALEFFDANRYRWDSRGDVTAIQEMDNQLLALTEDDIHRITGEENDGTGAGATLTLDRLASGTGCIEPRSVVLHPLGTMFQSGKGFYALSRGLELDYANAGAAVEDLVLRAGNIRAATLLQDRHEIRLVCNDVPVAGAPQPQILVYNYEHKIWSRFPMPDLVGDGVARNALQDGCAWRGRNGEVCHVVLAEGGLAIERGTDDTAFTDESYSGETRYAVDVQSEWVHLAGMAGLKRIPRFAIQTERVAAGAMTVEAWYDLELGFDESSPSETFDFPDPAPPLLVCKPFEQKITSLMVRVYESGTVPGVDSVRIVSLTLTIGRKKGQRRVPVSDLGTPT